MAKTLGIPLPDLNERYTWEQYWDSVAYLNAQAEDQNKQANTARPGTRKGARRMKYLDWAKGDPNASG